MNQSSTPMTPYQMPLSIGATFTYRPEHFVEHAGVRSLVDQIELSQPGKFMATVVIGAVRTGKTHFAFWAMERLSQLGFNATLRVAPDSRGLDQHISSQPPALIVDDAQNLLLSEAHIPAFVALYEQVRQNSGIVILLSDRPLQSANPHLQSRLASLVSLALGNPEREDLAALLLALAKQRGLKLSERNRSFLERRLGSQISDIERYVERLLKLSSMKDGRIGIEMLKDAI